MGLFLAIVFIIVVFLNFLSKQLRISNYKSREREAQNIARKYGGTGYPTAHLRPHQTTPENYAKYKAEIDALDRRRGYKKD